MIKRCSTHPSKQLQTGEKSTLTNCSTSDVLPTPRKPSTTTRTSCSFIVSADILPTLRITRKYSYEYLNSFAIGVCRALYRITYYNASVCIYYCTVYVLGVRTGFDLLSSRAVVACFCGGGALTGDRIRSRAPPPSAPRSLTRAAARARAPAERPTPNSSCGRARAASPSAPLEMNLDPNPKPDPKPDLKAEGANLGAWGCLSPRCSRGACRAARRSRW